MQIPGIQTAPDVSALAKRNGPPAAGAAKPAAAGGTTPAATPATSAMRQILAEYDVTNISPSELSSMVQKLVQAGAVSPQEGKDLAAMRVDLEQAGIEPSQSINLVDFYRERAQEAQDKFDGNPAPPSNSGCNLSSSGCNGRRSSPPATPIPRTSD